MKSESAFSLGQKVFWESQSGGVTTKKSGTVVLDAKSAQHQLPSQAFVSKNPTRSAKALFPNHKLMFDGITWEEGRVVVEVLNGNRKPALYMPRLKNLHCEP